MKARNAMTLAALVALALPAAATAQQGPRGPHGPGASGSLVERWIELREELDLTDEQVARLEAIGQALREENAEHRARIRAVREELGLPEVGPRARAPEAEGERGERRRQRPTDEERQRMRDFMDRTRDDMRAIGDNAREAMDRARELLTDEQREMLRERMRTQMRERRGMRGERGLRGQRGSRGERGLRGMRGTRSERGFRGERYEHLGGEERDEHDGSDG